MAAITICSDFGAHIYMQFSIFKNIFYQSIIELQFLLASSVQQSESYRYVCICLCICIYVCIYACVSVYMCVCMSVYLYICVYICLCICIYVCIYVCVSVYMYAAKSLSRVRLCATPSLGFSRQEHWSGLPFPSMHKSEKWKWSRSVMSDSLRVGCHCLLRIDIHIYIYGFPRWLSGKEPTCQCRRHGFNSWAGKIPWRRKWQPTPVFLPGQSHGRRSLLGLQFRGLRRVRHDLATKQRQQLYIYIILDSFLL